MASPADFVTLTRVLSFGKPSCLGRGVWRPLVALLFTRKARFRPSEVFDGPSVHLAQKARFRLSEQHLALSVLLAPIRLCTCPRTAGVVGVIDIFSLRAWLAFSPCLPVPIEGTLSLVLFTLVLLLPSPSLQLSFLFSSSSFSSPAFLYSSFYFRNTSSVSSACCS